jgi:hypothetical protein
MSVFGGPKVTTDSLSLALDPFSNKSFPGEPTNNYLNAATASISRYNNPGFSGTAENTGQTFQGCPIWRLTFIPQTSDRIARLGSTEGFGALHSMGLSLLADTDYLYSIYFKTQYPLASNSTEGFSNTYSNISGWGQNSTGNTRIREGEWYRLYTMFKQNVNGYCSRNLTYPGQYGSGTTFTVNTTSTEIIDVQVTVQSSGILDFTFLHAIVGANPTILDNGGLTGLSIVNHGLDTENFTRLSWPNTIKLKEEIPFTYYIRLSVPSTGGTNVSIRLGSNFVSYTTAISDSKFWKVTFNVSNLLLNDTIETFWACPMAELKSSPVFPSKFLISGTRSNLFSQGGGFRSLTESSIGGDILNGLVYNNTGTITFDGVDDYIDLGSSIQLSNNFTLQVWIRNGNTGYILDQGNIGGDPTGCLEWTNRGLTLASNNLSGVTADGTITSSVWNNITCSFSNGETKFYINGKLDSTKTASFSSFSPTGILKIGRRAFNTSSIFSGEMSMIKIYNRVLSDSEIAQNFQALRGRLGI